MKLEIFKPESLLPTITEMRNAATKMLDRLMQTESALPLYIQARAVAEVASILCESLKDLAISEALTEAGGAYGKSASVRGVGVQVRTLPAKWEGYSDAVLQKEAELCDIQEELRKLKKIEQLQGVASKVSQGETIAITFQK
jgi:hypothetical protein